MNKIHNLGEAAEAIAAALAAKQRLATIGTGSKAALGRSVGYDAVLDLSAMCGVVDYQPEELILTVRAGTSMNALQAVLAEAGQMLPFDPPDFSRLLATGAAGTIGGVLAANLSGPRRLTAGAARDYLLGFEAVSGRGEFFKSGGKVVKNVTGYDLSKLMCGSFGTLAVMDEITLKTLPRPETAVSLLFGYADMAAATAAIAAIFASPHEPHAAAILPAALAGQAGIDLGTSYVVIIRLEGIAVSVDDRASHLLAAGFTATARARLEADLSADLWQSMRDVDWFTNHQGAIWKLSVAPAAAAPLLADIGASFDVTAYADWAGGLFWLAGPSGPELATALRAAVAAAGGGYAQLIIDKNGGAEQVPPFQPLPAAHFALHQRVKAAFDPGGVLNFGRMHDGI